MYLPMNQGVDLILLTLPVAVLPRLLIPLRVTVVRLVPVRREGEVVVLAVEVVREVGNLKIRKIRIFLFDSRIDLD